MHEALLWEPDGDRVHCLPVPAPLPDRATGARGVCGVREQRRRARSIALTYGAGLLGRGRPDREEAGLPLPPRHARRSRSAASAARCAAGTARTGRSAAPTPGATAASQRPPARRRVADMAREVRLPGRRVHLQRAGHLGRVRPRRRRAAAARRGLYTVMVTNGYITEEGLDALGDAHRRVARRRQGHHRRGVPRAVQGAVAWRRCSSRPSARRSTGTCTSRSSRTSSRRSTTTRRRCAASRRGSRRRSAPTRRGTSRGSSRTSSSRAPAADADRDARAALARSGARRACTSSTSATSTSRAARTRVCPACGAVAVERHGLHGHRGRATDGRRVRRAAVRR